MPDYTSFVTMSHEEALAYLHQFEHETPSALERLSRLVSVTIEPTRSSLGDAWDAATPLLAWRAGYAPPRPGRPGPKIDVSELERADQLPSWFHHPSGAGYARFSAETLWLIDGLARHLGESAVHQLGAEWGVGRSRTTGYMFQNQPVIVRSGMPDPVSPLQSCAIVVAGRLSARSRGPQTMSDVFDRWVTSTT